MYIHIPFCNSFCDYCDFYSVKRGNFNDDYIDAFLSALIMDIKYQLEFFRVEDISTVYIGGGTPSVLGEKISVLFDALKEIPSFPPQEFSVEANPESVTEEFLDACREGGINRLSLGVQTFYEPSRRAVNRQGSGKLLEERLALCAAYFPDSLSVDLITGLPFQDEKIAIEDVSRLFEYKPVHVSLYSLTLESGTPLENKVKSKTCVLPDSNKADALWLTGSETLINAGFDHYEVSNFALEGKQCLHNLRYWQMDNWIGAGPSASGTVINEKTGTAIRHTYAPDVDDYIKNPLIHSAIRENIDKTALIKESLLMGYRYRKGPDKEKFKKRFGICIKDCIPNTLTKWKDKNKMLFLNSFLSDAFIELEDH